MPLFKHGRSSRDKGSRNSGGPDFNDARTSAEYDSRRSVEDTRRNGAGEYSSPASSRTTDPTDVQSTTNQLGNLSLGGQAAPQTSTTTTTTTTTSQSPSSPRSRGTPTRQDMAQGYGQQSRRSMDPTPNGQSPTLPRQSLESKSRTSAGAATTSRRRGHSSAVNVPQDVQLPEGFGLRNSIETEVDTIMRPAVTRETIKHHTTEIIHQPIVRDVHVHHDHTVVQPIRVVEVLPARHFRLDEATGQKIPIEAPSDWIMPRSMQPTGETDLSGVKGSFRHYVVDEANPRGKLEDPSLLPAETETYQGRR